MRDRLRTKHRGCNEFGGRQFTVPDKLRLRDSIEPTDVERAHHPMV